MAFITVFLAFMFVFLDSFQLMTSSLYRLAANLLTDAFIYTYHVFQGEKLALMKQKGIYPYDYMDSEEKFHDQQLPSEDIFYSLLTDEGITDGSYAHAQKVWNTFKIRTIGEYHDLYLKSDKLLLADVFENLRKACLQYYKLDPYHYFTSPGLSWDAMLKMTNVQLELMTDIDMFQFIEKGMRAGISYIGLCNAISKHWRKVFRRDNENDLVVSDESVQPPTFRQARAFYVSKSFQKPTSEVRLIEAGFTDKRIAASYVLPFKLTKNEKLSMFEFKINHHILKKKRQTFQGQN